MLLLSRSLQMVVAALFQSRGGGGVLSKVAWPPNGASPPQGKLLALEEEPFLHHCLGTLPRKTASGQLCAPPTSRRPWRFLRSAGSQESMQSIQGETGWWFPPRCSSLLAVLLLGLFTVLSQLASGSEMLVVKSSESRAVAKTALQSGSWSFLF